MGRNRQSEIFIEDPQLRLLIQNLCKNVKKRRQEIGLTQSELASKSQLALNTIAEIEQQRIENIRLSTVTALAKALKVPPLKLMSRL